MVIPGLDTGGEDASTPHSESRNRFRFSSVFNRSCDSCSARKRKCDGLHPCSRCVGRGDGRPCIYSRRKPSGPRRKKAWESTAVVDHHASSEPTAYASTNGSAVVMETRAQRGVQSLKRCRFSASPAVGLVGMQENVFLTDFFGCMGFIPLISQSHIREIVVKMIVASVPLQTPGAGYRGAGEQKQHNPVTSARSDRTAVSSSSELLTPVTLCVFWCTVALGALVQGRPVESCIDYLTRATSELERYTGPPTAELARAWALTGYVYSFYGDADRFYEGLHNADVLLRNGIGGEEDDVLPVGFDAVIDSGKAVKLFMGKPGAEEVQEFCSSRTIPPPEIGDFPTDGELYRSIMLSCRPLEKALYATACGFAPDGTPNSGEREGDLHELKPPKLDALAEMPSVGIADVGKALAPLDVSAAATCLGGAIHTVVGAACDRQVLEYAADRQQIRDGIGGLIINTTLLLASADASEFDTVFERLKRCVDVFERYPGLFRHMKRAHDPHVFVAVLTSMDHPEARPLFERLRAGYNRMKPPDFKSMPPYEEYNGMEDCCDMFFCRSMEAMVKSWFAPPPTLLEHPAEAQTSSCSDESDSSAGSALSCDDQLPWLPCASQAILGEKGLQSDQSHPGTWEFYGDATDGRDGYRDSNSTVLMESFDPGVQTTKQEQSPAEGVKDDKTEPSSDGCGEPVEALRVGQDVGCVRDQSLGVNNGIELVAPEPSPLSGGDYERAWQREEENDIATADWLEVTHALLKNAEEGSG